MSDSTNGRKPIPDPASQHTERDDTSIVPDLTNNPADDERARMDGADSTEQ